MRKEYKEEIEKSKISKRMLKLSFNKKLTNCPVLINNLKKPKKLSAPPSLLTLYYLFSSLFFLLFLFADLPSTQSALDADIEYLKQQKDQLNEVFFLFFRIWVDIFLICFFFVKIVQLFEEEEKAMAKKSTRRIEDDEEKGERSEETEA